MKKEPSSVQDVRIQESDTSSPVINGASLARNTVLNLLGQVLPLLTGVLLIPYVIRGLGPDRFGMLGIIWVVFGYFSVMDLGLGRATTKFLAEWLASGETSRIRDMVWSSILVQVMLGAAGTVIIASLTPFLVDRTLKAPAALMAEGRTAFYILAIALPIILASNGLRAVLEGCQRFDLSNLLRIPSTSLAFVIPAIGVAVGLKLPGIVLWLSISRLIFLLAHIFYCTQILPCLKTRPSICWQELFPLISFGGWVTASNLVNPILLTMDRFLIGMLLSVAMVGYYTAPYEAVTKLWVIPASLMTTLYPACSALAGNNRLVELQAVYSRSIKYIFCGIAPVSLILVLFARPLVGAWLGVSFVDKSTIPLQFFAVGVFINCFAHVPYGFLQALGKPDAAAKLFLAELIPYAALAWTMIAHYGIAGAATAWSIRVAIEVVLLFWLAAHLLSLSPLQVEGQGMWTALLLLAAVGFGMYATNYFLGQRILADACVCALWIGAFSAAVWKWVLDTPDKITALALIDPMRNLLRRPAVLQVDGD